MRRNCSLPEDLLFSQGTPSVLCGVTYIRSKWFALYYAAQKLLCSTLLRCFKSPKYFAHMTVKVQVNAVSNKTIILLTWGVFVQEELYALCSSPNVIREIKSRRMRWAGNVALMRDISSYRVLVGRSEGKRSLAGPRHRWNYSIEMDI